MVTKIGLLTRLGRRIESSVMGLVKPSAGVHLGTRREICEGYRKLKNNGCIFWKPVRLVMKTRRDLIDRYINSVEGVRNRWMCLSVLQCASVVPERLE